MTHKQFERKARSLARKVADGLVAEMLRLSKSGGMNLVEYHDDYEAARIALWAAMGRARTNWAPFHKPGMDEARNLEHF